MPGEEVAQVFVVLPQVFFQFVQPFAAFVVSCDQGFDCKGIQCVEFVIDELPVDFPAHLGIGGDDVGCLQTGDVEGLARGGAGDRMPQKLFVQRGERNVAMAVERQVAVDFVRYDRYPVPQADLPEAGKLFGVQARPAGLWGLHRKISLACGSAALRSRSSKSMR